MTLRSESHIVTNHPVRGKLQSIDGKATPILHFLPVLEGAFDIYPSGAPAEQIAFLMQLRDEAGALAVMVQRHAAQVEAFKSYEVPA